MNRETLNEFIEKQCDDAYNDGERGTWSDGWQQAMNIEWAIDKYIQTNFKEEQNDD